MSAKSENTDLCWNCNRPIRPTALKCSYCGSDLLPIHGPTLPEDTSVSLSEDSILCPNCRSSVNPSATICHACNNVLTPKLGPTEPESTQIISSFPKEDDIPPEPRPDEFPPYLRKVDVFLILFIILVGVVWNFSIFRPDRDNFLTEWLDEYNKALENKTSTNWNKNVAWPPEQPINIVSSIQPDNLLFDYSQELINNSNIVQDDYIKLSQGDFSAKFVQLLNANPDKHWLTITGTNNLLFLSLNVAYWSPELKGIPVFEFRKINVPIFSYWRPLVQLSIIVFICSVARTLLIERYRKKRKQAFEAYQNKRTEELFAAKARLDEAKSLVEADDIAKALVIVNSIVNSVPDYKEAYEYKTQLEHTQHIGHSKIISTDSSKVKNQPINESTSPANLLFLQILKTPYPYLLPSNLDAVIIGRKLRKPGESRDVGSDLVIRVPGSDNKSRRISRRHLEITRIDDEYFVKNISTHGITKLNGRSMSFQKALPLKSKDQLNIADVLVLKALIRPNLNAYKSDLLSKNSPRLVNLDDELSIEVTVGDMVTEIEDD